MVSKFLKQQTNNNNKNQLFLFLFLSQTTCSFSHAAALSHASNSVCGASSACASLGKTSTLVLGGGGGRTSSSPSSFFAVPFSLLLLPALLPRSAHRYLDASSSGTLLSFPPSSTSRGAVTLSTWAIGETAAKRARSSASGLALARRRPSRPPQASTNAHSGMSETAAIRLRSSTGFRSTPALNRLGCNPSRLAARNPPCEPPTAAALDASASPLSAAAFKAEMQSSTSREPILPGEQLQAALSVALRVCFWFKFQLERKKKERKSEVLFFCARKLEKKKN